MEDQECSAYLILKYEFQGPSFYN